MAFDPKARPRVRLVLYFLGSGHSLYDPKGGAVARLTELCAHPVHAPLIRKMQQDGELLLDPHLPQPAAKRRFALQLTRKGAELALADAIAAGVVPENTELVWQPDVSVVDAIQDEPAARRACEQYDAYRPSARRARKRYGAPRPPRRAHETIFQRERRIAQRLAARKSQAAAAVQQPPKHRTSRAPVVSEDLLSRAQQCINYIRNRAGILSAETGGLESELAQALSVDPAFAMVLTRKMAADGMILRQAWRNTLFVVALPECKDAFIAAVDATDTTPGTPAPQTHPEAPAPGKKPPAAKSNRTPKPPAPRRRGDTSSIASAESREIQISSSRKGTAPALPMYFTRRRDRSLERERLADRLERYVAQRDGLVADPVNGLGGILTTEFGCTFGELRDLTRDMMDAGRIVRVSWDGQIRGLALPSFERQLRECVQPYRTASPAKTAA